MTRPTFPPASKRPTTARQRLFGLILVLSSSVLLSSCERLGIEDPIMVNKRLEEDAKAIGAACRHAGRAIEDCFAINPDASRSHVYEGWREMNDYMLDKEIQAVAPKVAPDAPPPPPEAKKKKKKKDDGEEAH